MQTMVRHKAELEGDSLRHIQPVQFVMKESRQTTIKFLRVADYSGGGVEHSLQLVSDRLRSSCIDNIAIINPCISRIGPMFCRPVAGNYPVTCWGRM